MRMRAIAPPVSAFTNRWGSGDPRRSRIDCVGNRHDLVGAELHVRCTRRDSMIPNYTNHAANERTFLAWIRTGLAVAAFGFFLIKLNVFVDAVGGGSMPHLPAEHAGAVATRYAGLAMVAIGIATIA